jgi:hypothetical protein
MRSSSATSLKGRITQMLWVGNAVGCAFLALHGGLMCFGVFGYDAPLSALSVPAGALLAGTSAALTVFSLWKTRSTSASR